MDNSLNSAPSVFAVPTISTLSRRIAVSICIVGSTLVPDGVRAVQLEASRDSTVFFFQDLPFGSQALFNPLTVVLNKGYDILQLSSSSRYIWDFPYGNGFKAFFPDVIRNPIAAIERDPGWDAWIRTEILPLSVGEAGWIVNWTEHFLGGGITHRGLTDWYQLKGFPAPKVLAGITTMAASVLNEVVEHPGAKLATSSSVADLWIFDLGGILLFSWDRPARWAARHLRLADWSNMASFTVPSWELENNGQYFVLKPPLPLENQRLFIRFGLGAQFGITHALDAEKSVSLALGLDTRGRTVDPETGRESIDMMFGGGAYLDRNNSLLASLTLSAAQNRVALNLYPGLVAGRMRNVGAWLVYTHDNEVRVGLIHTSALGIGLGIGRKRSRGR